MKVKELIKKLQACSPEDEVEIYLGTDFCDEYDINAEYYLLEVVVTNHEGWEGLTTLEPGKLMGG